MLLDEFQDCTGWQYELVKLAFVGTDIPITAVGDTKQKIMRWAGALEGIFQTFAGDFSALPLNLYQNFRSDPRLRRLQNAMVRRMDPAAAVPDETLRGDEGDLDVLRFDSALDEASHLAELIRYWIAEEGVPASEIAILVSKQPELYAQTINAELGLRKIPVRNEQAMQDLTTEPIFVLASDFLKVVFGDREPDAFCRLINRILPLDLDEDEEYQLTYRWRSYFEAVQAAIDLGDPPTASGLIKDAIEGFFDTLGENFITAQSADYEHGDFVKDVMDRTTRRVLDLLAESDDPVQALTGIEADDSVKILTIHKCKGLEFHSVIVLGVEEETFWGDREDERAAFFVAISRAKHRLMLTHVRSRPRPSGANWRWRVRRTPHSEFLQYVSLV